MEQWVCRQVVHRRQISNVLHGRTDGDPRVTNGWCEWLSSDIWVHPGIISSTPHPPTLARHYPCSLKPWPIPWCRPPRQATATIHLTNSQLIVFPAGGLTLNPTHSQPSHRRPHPLYNPPSRPNTTTHPLSHPQRRRKIDNDVLQRPQRPRGPTNRVLQRRLQRIPRVRKPHPLNIPIHLPNNLQRLPHPPLHRPPPHPARHRKNAKLPYGRPRQNKRPLENRRPPTP